MRKKIAPLVGHELRRLRESKPVPGRKGKSHWSREYVADLAGCSTGSVNNVETKSENATFETVDSICVALGTTLEDVLCRVIDREEKTAILDAFRKSSWMEAEKIDGVEVDGLMDLPITKILGSNPSHKKIASLILSRRLQ